MSEPNTSADATKGPNQPGAEAELEAFRQRWREEVQARNRGASVQTDLAKTEQNHITTRLAPTASGAAGPSKIAKKDAAYYAEELEPRAYHDLPNKEDILQLGEEGQSHNRSLFKEPNSALEHYERAVEKETQGQLGESVKHYRTAFKLDDEVHEKYKKKHFPPSSFVKPKPSNPNPSNAAVTVPNPAHHSLHGSIGRLVDNFVDLRIEPPPPATDASPQERCYMGELPEEILTQILRYIAMDDVSSFARLSFVCKRLAYLVSTEEGIWKDIALGSKFGFKAMHYDFNCDVEGDTQKANDQIARYLEVYDEDDETNRTLPRNPEERWLDYCKLSEELLHSTYNASWRDMFRTRPRIRFNGCYISTVNYTRPGAQSTNTLTWGVPMHVVTYFRYLRFFRDGTVISLLTTVEPVDVVHHLTKDNLHDHHGNTLPSSVMKDALRGRWRLSGPSSSVKDTATAEAESEGELYVDTEGVVPKYTYHMLLALSHAGKAARNNKLAWKGFWSHNRLTDDIGEFGLRNDRAFYWSRVKSYRAY